MIIFVVFLIWKFFFFGNCHCKWTPIWFYLQVQLTVEFRSSWITKFQIFYLLRHQLNIDVISRCHESMKFIFLNWNFVMSFMIFFSKNSNQKITNCVRMFMLRFASKIVLNTFKIIFVFHFQNVNWILHIFCFEQTVELIFALF